MEQTIDKTKPVLVTGASGYIANWIILDLLQAGYTVHGTVRDPDNQRSVGPLHKLAARAPQGRLQLFRADLLEPGSFDAAMEGCEVVLHTASPFVIRGFDDAEAALIRPAVEGTRNVLEAANRVASVQRVVLTSSVAAIYGDNADLQEIPRDCFTEEDWNFSSGVYHQPYSYSKLLAEKEAWKIHDAQSRWRLVCINPSMVCGPALTPFSQSTSIDTLRSLGTGKMWPGAPELRMAWVDVRDVAQAHLEAAFRPDANGRHIVSNGELSFLQVAQILKRHYGSGYRFPVFELPKFVVKWFGWMLDSSVKPKFVERNVGHAICFDNSRGRKRLGLEYRPLEQTFVDHFQQMIDDGLIRA
ncbi:MAG: aldehyde reductase [Pseudomonadota bacterium]|nr:diaminohydroxyphosphoribosylaminopyrimidine deaminase [Pseudomonadales bacterium]MDY6919446.1 aldehyde reductase [Pseudomonadota bacterium]